MGMTNCWEFMKCGCEGQCPAHPGNGRDCWRVSNTLCWGEVQGSPEEKHDNCLFKCGFPEKIAKNEV